MPVKPALVITIVFNRLKQFIMKNSTLRMVGQQFAILLLLLTVSQLATAQFRNYGIIYSENLRGNTALFGNTLMHITRTSDGSVRTDRMNENAANGNSQYGNDGSNMTQVDIDGSTGVGAGTRNSSSADLQLPAGTNTIKMARLYWGGRVLNSDFTSFAGNRNIKIRFGTSNTYTELGSLQIDSIQVGSGSTAYFNYQMYTDITNIIQANGSGTYTVGNAPLSQGSVGGGGYYGGWTIVVVYENQTLPFSSVRVYDGFRNVFNGGNPLTSSVTLTGLDVPSGTLSNTDAKMGVMTWEGDANLTGDFLRINGNTFSNGINASNNPWNGTISEFGSHVTTKNPNYTNQMALDIDQFYVGTGYGIQPNATSVDLLFGTEADQYFPGLFTFVIRMKDPTITLDKLVRDASGNNQPEANEVLTYTLRGKNLGVGNANQLTILDTLPNTVTYVPGSMKVNYCVGVTPLGAKSDALGDDHGDYIVSGPSRIIRFLLGNGSDGTNAGWIASLDSFEVEFKVTVNPTQTGIIPPIINVARVQARSDANVLYTDDGLAVLNPSSGPLPVILSRFTAQLAGNNQVRVNWATSLEINCSHYIVERSLDGRMFQQAARVAGSGNSSVELSYGITDDISGLGANIVYYRLRQVDLDGKNNVSRVVSVRVKKAASDFVVAPNPFRNHVNITLDWSKQENTTIRLFNSQGAEVARKQFLMIAGSNYLTFDELSKLPTGTYYLQVATEEGNVVKKITKQ